MNDRDKGERAWGDAGNLTIAVHMGALGDFLLIWPALYSLARHFAKTGGGQLYWGGRMSHAQWAEGAGWLSAPPGIRKGVEALYAAERWPEALAGAGVVWLGLAKRPMDIEDERLRFIPCVEPGERSTSPREVARKILEEGGVAWCTDWRESFRTQFGVWGDFEQAYDVLLFPGAGHRAKQWAPGKFFELAMRLQGAGRRAAFVLGPAEVERGFDPLHGAPAGKGALPEVLRPGSLEELSSLLVRTRCVMGNDCGPMHLASMHGTPGVVLFGPTSRRQWAPEGLVALAGSVDCRPCTATTAGIACSEPKCMGELAVGEVWERLAPFLE